MREKTAAARKGPASLGGLDDVLAGKGEPVTPRVGVTPPSPAAPQNTSAAVSAGKESRTQGEGATLSTIRIPYYLSERIADYLHANRGDTMQTLFFKGLVKLGIEVAPEDLVPKRQRRAR